MQTGAPTYQQEAAKNRRDRLILEHLPLVKHALGRLLRHVPAGVDYENLESAGILGLVEAANRFDPERGVEFKTYAYLRIRGAVVDEMRRNSSLPQQLLEHAATLRRAYQELPAPATVEALAAATGFSEEQVSDCLAALRMARPMSLDKISQQGQGEPASPDPRPAHEVEQNELRQFLAEAIAKLPERERLIVTLYYLEDLRLKEIGAILGLSESRVSRLLDASIFKLGEYFRALDA